MFNVTILSDGRKWTLFAVVSGWTFLFGTRLIYPALVEFVRADFGISNAIVGLLFTFIMFTYSIMQFPSGVFSDRIGEKTVLLASLLITIGSCVLLTGAPTFVLFAVGCIAFGLGTGLYSTPQISILTKLFPEREATVHGIAYAAGGIGTALPVIAGAIAVQFDWRLGFGFVIPALVITLYGVWRLVPNQGDSEPAGDGPPLRDQFRFIAFSVNSPTVILPFLATVLVAFTYQGLTAFLPAYLIDVKQFQTLHATIVYGLFFTSGTFFQVIAGALADRYNRELNLTAIGLIGGLALLVISISTSNLLTSLLVIPLGTINAFISLGNTQLIAELPDDIQGGGLGLLRTFIISVASLASVAIGYFADLELFTEAIITCSILVLAAGVLCGCLYRHE